MVKRKSQKKKWFVLLGLAVLIVALLGAKFGTGPRAPIVLSAGAAGPIGTNWNFSLSSGDSVVSVERDNHEAIMTVDNITITNSYRFVFSGSRFLRPGTNWDFNVFVPKNATRLQVFSYIRSAPKSLLLFEPVFNRKAPRFFEPMQEAISEKIIGPMWEEQEVRSAVWIRTGDSWQIEQ